MTCRWVMNRLAQYVDCAVGPIEAALVRFHLVRCAACYERYEHLEFARNMVRAFPPPRPSPNFETRLMSAFSIEAVRRSHPGWAWQRLRLKLDNLMRPLALPAFGGMVLALVLVPALLSAFWMEPTAHADDIPLRLLAQPLVTAPVMVMRSPCGVDRDYTVLAYIDQDGGVYDYTVATDEPLNNRMLGQLGNLLLTSRFQPAQRFGQPTLGQAVILFQRVESMA